MRVMCFVLVLVGGVLAGVARGETLEAEMRRRASDILNRAMETGDLLGARDSALALRDEAVAYCRLSDLDSIMVADLAHIQLHYAINAKSQGVEVLRALVDRPELASHLLFAWENRIENEEEGARVLLRLVRERPRMVDAFPALAAAVSLVHDVPGGLTRRINENTSRAADPLAIFDHFTKNEGRLAISPKSLPVKLLRHVVDTTSSPEDLEWALRRHGRRPDPGLRFFEIKYDYDSFYEGTEKKLTASGRFDVQAIKELGGVCADQAYYAEEIGKACGVPTVYVVAKGAEVSHAWIGFLEIRGRRATWNLDSGRYEAYQNLRGNISLAGSSETMSDSTLKLTAGLFGTSNADRWAAMSASHVVWNSTHRSKVPEPGKPEATNVLTTPRSTGDIGQMLELLRSGVKRAPFQSHGWRTVGALGSEGRLSLDQLDEWGIALDRLCGRKYADFSIWILRSMIGGIESQEEQLKMWEWVHGKFGKRPDLAAQIRIRQATISQKLGDTDRAWWAVMDVINRYAGQTPDVVTAASMAQTMLIKSGKRDQVPQMLKNTWKKIPKPRDMGGVFRVQSNWYKVGTMYANSMRTLNPTERERVRTELKQ